MRIIMIKKRLQNGEPCKKCHQTETMLKKRDLWHHIDEVIWALEGDPESLGMQVARRHDVPTAPFFIVTEADGTEVVYTSALKLIRERLTKTPSETADDVSKDAIVADIHKAARTLDAAEPQAIVRWALERFGQSCAIAFSGAEDVVLIDMAAKTGLPFSVFCLDTGRLHPETYEFLDKVRAHYGIEIAFMSPNADALQAFVRTKGLFSFYEDGHQECCAIRKVEPLERALATCRAWITGQRRDQNPETRQNIPTVQIDPRFRGQAGDLVKCNPLAHWSSQQTWDYIYEHDVPYNALHKRGYISIGCAPCTRAVLPGQHERQGRWWWEQTVVKECGLHTAG